MKRREILQAALSFVPQHGWTKQSLVLGSSNCVFHCVWGRFVYWYLFESDCNWCVSQAGYNVIGSDGGDQGHWAWLCRTRDKARLLTVPTCMCTQVFKLMYVQSAYRRKK